MEVDQFIKSQMKFRVVMKAIFTSLEQFLIRNDKVFVLNKKSKTHDSSSLSSDKSSDLKSLIDDLQRSQPFLNHLIR